MPTITLRRFLRKEKGEFIQNFLAPFDEPVGVFDPEGGLLIGTPTAGQLENAAADELRRTPVFIEGETAGWVIGRKDSTMPALLGEVLIHLLREDSEKRALAAEVLDKYRELHLLYRLSERLITSPQPDVIGRMALEEVCTVVQTSQGMLLLIDDQKDLPQIIAANGDSYVLRPEALLPDRLIGRVVATGNAEIGNHLPANDYFTGPEIGTISILCAPLKVENRVFGAFILIGDNARTFSAGDLKLLNAIALQTAPAIEIAHLHQVELQNAWIERDMQTARQVQTGLLPSQMPALDGWDVAAFWKPARAVSGDLYDFLYFPDGKLGLVVADVTDKGVPAALLMANARSTLRGAAVSAGQSGWDSPGRLLAQVNQVLSEEMPMDMFVTCLLVVLDPKNGHFRYANAGHNPPYLRTSQGVVELRATGIPLGLFEDLEYEEKEAFLEPGDTLLMYSDGLIEAHNPDREMFGFPRLHALLAGLPADQRVEGCFLIDLLMKELDEFLRPGTEQEDDITMVSITRSVSDG